MPAFDQNGRAHNALRFLARERATFAGICAGIRSPDSKKFRARMALLEQRGFVIVEHDPYRITPVGMEALRALNAGEDVDVVGQPNVRMFTASRSQPCADKGPAALLAPTLLSDGGAADAC